MRCSNCGSENNDSAKFCKKCGTPLQKKSIDHESIINSVADSKNDNNTTKYIIIALIVVCVVLAGAFIYIYGFGSNDDASDSDSSSNVVNNTPVNTVEQQTQQAQPAQPQTTSMEIRGGSFSTGSDLSDKTKASIYVGSQHAGEKVTIQIFYSRDGNTLNNGNMVPKTVDSSGYINVNSADAYKYYPDFAEINLYDNSGNLLDSASVSLNPDSGTQTFTL